MRPLNLSLRHVLTFGILWLGAISVSCDPSPIAVTTTNDGGSGSLRAAIDSANSSSSASVRIEVPPGTYQLTRCAADDTNAGGDLDITTQVPISIVGTGPGVIIKQTCPGERVLDDHGAGLLTVSGLTLTGGNTSDPGGGIRGQTVALSQVTVTGNNALNGGGVAVQKLTAEQLTLTENTASTRGGGILASSEATITRSTIGNNLAESGGGLAVDGPLTISDSRVTANRARRTVVVPVANFTVDAPTSGAGVVAKSVQGDRVTIDNNSLSQCTVFSHLIIPTGNSTGAGIQADSVTLTNSTLTNNSAPSCSGFGFAPAVGIAIYAQSVTLDHATVADNAYGSAINAPTLVSHRSLIVGPAGGVLCTGVTRDDTSYNRLGDGTCGTFGPGDGQVSAFLLGPLTDNGGFVPTRLPSLASDLVDQIPPADCPVKIDARGKSRPQGAGCDIGAVEAEIPPGFGPADLSVAFSNPPPSLKAGASATWQIALDNRGPNAQAPAVFIDTPDALRVTALSAGGGASCSNQTTPKVCVFPTLASGARQIITLQGELARPTDSLALHAKVGARGLLPPLTDDEAALTTPVVVDASIHMQVDEIGEQVTVNLFNDGPFSAMGTQENLIHVLFHPAAGVHVGQSDAGVFGLFASSPDAFASPSFVLTFDGAPPAELGTVELQPGPNRLSGPASVPVFYAARPDLRLAVWRTPGVVAAGASLPITVEVENVGAGAAQNATVALDLTPETTWTPPFGSVEKTTTGYVWKIPSLGAGIKAQLLGSLVAPAERSWLTARAQAPGDVDGLNDRMDLEVTASPDGTADLQITVLDMTGSGPWYVRATITNAGPAVCQAQPLDSVIVQVGDLDGSTPNGSVSASVLRSSIDWSCSGDRCSTSTSLPAGSSHSFEFRVDSSEQLKGFSLLVRGGIDSPDPDPRNNAGTIAR